MGTRKSVIMAMLVVLLTAFAPMIMAQEFKAVTIGNYDNVTVIEFTGNYNTPILNNPANEFPRQVIAKEFYRTHKDDYDFLVIFSNFDFQMPILDIAGTQYMAAGFYLPVRNDINGIGDDIFDNSFQFGSNGKLQGTVDMGYVGKKMTDPLDTGFEQTMTTLSHELLHRWSAYVKFKKWDGDISKDLLGSADAHWSFLLDTQGSMQYGNRWISNGNGTFTSLSGSKYYSSLDLYLMGLIPKDQVPPMFLIENPDINKKRLPEPGVTISGTPHTVSIDDIIAAEGERTPNAALSQKNFKIGCIYITRPGTFESRDEIFPLRNVLKNWAIWFSSLTKGKAMVRIDVRPEETVPVNPGITPPSYDERTAPPTISEALAWLLNAQEQNGSWRDSFQTLERETAEAIFTLGHFPETQANVSAGIDWLSGTTDLNTDYLSRKIEIFIRANLDTTALLGQLLAKQNMDGGWGSAGIYNSNAADTAMVLRALWAADIQTESVLRPAIDFLENEQHTDGGWGQDNQEGTIQTTANVLQVLTHYQDKYPLSEAIQKGLAWLFGKQNPDGGFGNSPSTIYDTALALNLLKSFAVSPDMTDKALDYILSFQSVNGSWYASPYQTAQALNALYLWQDRVAPDLSVTMDNFTFTPQTVTNPPEKIIIKAKVENLGLLEVSKVKVALYDGIVVEANKKGEVVISLAAKSSMNIEFEATIDDANAHTFIVGADPDNQIKEVNENNNQASKDLANLACLKPDLVVGSEGMVIEPESITTNPEGLTVRVLVQNISRAEAKDVKVALYDGEITPSAKVGEQNVTIVAGGSTLVHFNVTVSEAKSHVFHVLADPDNLLDECLETNNRVSKRIAAKTTYDFEAVQLSVSSPSMVLMDMLTITSQIANKGTSDAFNVPVRYFLNTPSGPHEIGLYYLNIPTGKTIEHTASWPADRVGENMALTVRADPSDVFKELSEDNNSITTLITVKQYTQPNLSIQYKDITVDFLPVREGSNTAITALIRNNGFSEAQNVVVEFYQGTSKTDLQLIGTQTIATLGAGQSRNVTQTWAQIAVSGSRLIFVAVDPGNSIEEFDESDNSAFITLGIQTLPDLAVSPHSIAFNPEAPKEGEALAIQVTVQNLGDQEAADVTVQLKENNQIIASDVITKIAGHSQSAISFQYETQGKPGGHRIDVTVDPQSLIPEKSKENNMASRSFGVQNADLWLSEPYISPNGDGIKDSTQFFFRLKQAQTVQVVVTNPKGKVVKTFSGDEFKNTSGNVVTWDGLDEQGRVDMDGQYQFQVRNSSSKVLAMLPVIVDTDRSPLTEAIGTKYLFQKNLTCVLPDISWWQWFPDESGIVFLIRYANANSPGYNQGIYTVSPDGEDFKRIVPAEWCENNGTGYDYYYDDVALASDGQKIAFVLRRRNNKTGRDEASQIWFVDRYGENRTLVLSSDLVNDGTGYFYRPRFSPNGQYLAYEREINGVTTLGLLKIDSSGKVELPLSSWIDLESQWSPDSTRICFQEKYLSSLRCLNISGEVETLLDSQNAMYAKAFAWLNQDSLILYTNRDIFFVDATGSGNHKLLVEEINGAFLDVAVNPKDQTIAYIAGGYQGGANYECQWRVGICDLQGHCSVVYTKPLQECQGGEGGIYSSLWDLAWSSDGQKIAFFDHTYEKISTGNSSYYQSYIVVLDKSGLKKQAVPVSTNEDSMEWNRRRSLQWFLDNESLLAEDQTSIFAAKPEEAEKISFPVQKKYSWDELGPQLSPHGRYITYDLRADETGICYDKGWSDLWAIGSLLNLTADLKVIKNKNSITLRGTAADLHFESYALQYADIDEPTNWKPIAPPSDQMVINHDFIEWIPPSEGIFLVRLVVQDKAGNTAWDRKRVSWGQFTSINDLQQSEKIFSPNGDNIKDTVTLSYKVAAPVHLQFLIYDEAGRLVRTIEKNYTEPMQGFMIWDGQNSLGMVVPDGVYRIQVLDYETSVEVDTTLPAGELQINQVVEIIRDMDQSCGSISISSKLLALATDRNVKTWLIEYGEGENPQAWYELKQGSEALYTKDKEGKIGFETAALFEAEWFDFPINKRFRITIEDLAGNRITVNTNNQMTWKELLFITSWGQTGIQYQGDANSQFEVCGQLSPEDRKQGQYEIKGLESILLPLAKLELQLHRNNEWVKAAETDHPSSGRSTLNWNNQIPVGELEAFDKARLRAVDINQAEYFSPIVMLVSPEFSLRGDKSCNSGRITQLRAQISIIEDLKILRFQIRSDDDPHYPVWTDFLVKEGGAIPTGSFTIENDELPQDLLINAIYSFRMVGIGLSGKEYLSRAQSTEEQLCLMTTIDYKTPCNALSNKAIIQVEVNRDQIKSIFLKSGSLEFKDIKYYLITPQSTELIGESDLRSLNWLELVQKAMMQPWDNSCSIPLVSHEISTVDLPVKDYWLDAIVNYSEVYKGTKKPSTAKSGTTLYVEHELPEARFTDPTDSTLLCPKQMDNGIWLGVDLKAVIDDTKSGVSQYAVFYSLPQTPEKWETAFTSWLSASGSKKSTPIKGQASIKGSLPVWDVTAIPKGVQINLKCEVQDRAGNVKCDIITCLILPIPNPQIACPSPLISPNGDGFYDVASIDYSVDQDAVVELNVLKSSDLSLIKTLTSTLVRKGEIHSIQWDGSNDDGQIVPDGKYFVVISVPNQCGNAGIKRQVTIEVDHTPPFIDISYPSPQDRPGLLVEVKGTVSDPHFKNYQLTVPEINTIIGSGEHETNNGILGRWNRYGLNGRYTIKLIAEDQVANKIEKLAEIQLDSVPDFIKNLEATPYLFSPNDDGRLEKTVIRYELSAAIPEGYQVTVTVLKDQIPIRIHAPGIQLNGIYQWEWDGEDNQGKKAVDGEYMVMLTASHPLDPTINQKETLTVEVDTIAPKIVMLQPGEGFFIKEDSVVCQGSITDVNPGFYELSLRAGNQTWPVESGKENRVNYIFGDMPAPPDGPCSLFIRTQDRAQNSTEKTISFIMDRTPPKVALSSPAEGELFGNKKEAVPIKGRIEETNLKQWAFSYGPGENPQAWVDLLTGNTLPTVEELHQWQIGNQSGIVDGLYTLRLQAKDKAGWETDAKVKVIVDNTPPVAIITVPEENGYVTKAMSIKGTAFDDNLVEYILEISAGDCKTADKWVLLKKEIKSVQDGTLALFSALPPDGHYCLRLKAIDKVGYESETKKGIIIDTAPPAAPILSGKVQNKANALLTWTANTEPDLAGYNFYRDNQKTNQELIKDNQYLDQALKEGIYNYMVKAVDKAGLESIPSNPVSLKIDLTPPATRILSPLENAKVNDFVAVKGTAYSEEDFKEYRLYSGQGIEPTVWNLLLRSPVPVPYGKLSDWDTIALTEGPYTIKLEAEDLSGNTNVHQIAVSIDNMPPGPPNLTKAEQQGPLVPNVDLTWNANPEPDVIGYLVYRNHELANVSGIVIGDLKPYLIKGTTYTDKVLPDGKFTYYIMAMDEAGNISEQSNSRDVNIDMHAPKVVITVPKDGHRFESTILVKGETPDLDIARVQFRYQNPGETIWNDLNSPVVNLPYITYLDPKSLNLAYGTYRLLAKGTDLGDRTDEAPAEITVYYTDTTAPLNPIELEARVDEGQVILNWKPNSEQDLNGYNIYKVAGSSKTKLNGAIISGTTTYIHGGSGNDALTDAEYIYEITALDTFGNKSKPSNQVKALVYTPLLEQPYTPSGVSPIQVIGNQAQPNDSIEIYISANEEPGTLQSKASADDQGKFTFFTPLPFEPTWIRVQAADEQGNRSKKSMPVVALYNEAPAAPTGLQGMAQDRTVHLTWNANTEMDLAGYYLYREGKKINRSTNVVTGTVSASYDSNGAIKAFDRKNNTYWYCYVYENTPQWWQLNLSKPELIQQLAINFSYEYNTPRDYDIQAWTGYTWLTLLQVKGNQQAYVIHELKNTYRTQRLRLLFKRAPEDTSTVTLFEVSILKLDSIATAPQPLFDDPDRPDGKYAYQISAVDTYGLESPLSAEVVVPVGDQTPPAMPINLTASSDQVDVNLTWTANTEPDLSGYQVNRQSPQGWVKINSALLTSNTYKDVGLANGTYTYRVTALDQIGNESEPSNEASAIINIGLPQQPINLQITTIPEGQALKICWEYNGGPAAGFNLYRALQPGGPYVKINADLIQNTCYLDEGLVNGVKYYYYVTAVDNFGNEGGSSPEQYAVPKDTVAPEPLVIFYPTLSGASLEVEKADQTLIGFAEPDSLVELFKDGDSLAKTNALKSAAEQIYALSSDTWQIAVSPDGRKIAYIENNKLFLKDLDANEAVTLNDSYTSAMRWLSDKKQLSFMAEDENGRARIFIYNVSTGEKTRLTDDNDVWEHSPSWNRDGKHAAFISDRDDFSKVWIKDLISGEMKNLINSNGALCPEISPDGSKVVYFKGNTLYLVNVVTEESQAIDAAAYTPNEYGTYNWSPDGKNLAFISYRNGANDLYIRDMQSGEVIQVSRFREAGLPLLGFKWSPDGKALLCLTQKENKYSFWTITVAAPPTLKILKQWSPGYIQTIDWIANGKAVYFHSGTSENDVGLIQLPGAFSFDVLLNPRDNIFTARAQDATGNLSEPSESVTLILPEQVLPDLEITTDTIFVYPAAPIVGDQIQVYAVVENKGMAEAKGFITDIYLKNSQDQWVLLKQEYIDRIAAGSSVAIPLILEADAYSGSNTLIVFVDAENRVYELSENNNFAQRDFYVATQEGIVMTTVLDAQEYQAESDLSIRISVHNSGPALELDLAVQIEDENGAVVHVFDLMTLNLSYGIGKDVDLKWNTGLIYAGHYRVRTILKEKVKIILENLTPFKIVPEISVSAELSTDKLHYGAMEDIFLNTLLMNQGRNFDIPHLDVRTSILHEGVQVFNNAFGLNNLPVDSSVNLSAVWNSGLSAAGTYQAQVEFLLEGQVITNSVADFFIDPEVKLSGELKAVPILVYFNRPVKADFIIHNKGNTGLDELAVKVLLLDPDTQKVLYSSEKTVAMDPGGNGSGQCEFSTIGLSLKAYKLILQVQNRGSTQTLATAVFSIKDGVPPNVTVLEPQNNSSQQQPFDLLVQVADDASSVNRVEYRLDQETQWRLLPPVDPATSQYGTKWVPKEAEEGPHTIWFRASDRAGNVSGPIATSIRIVPRVDMTISLNAKQYSMNEDAAIKVHLTNIAWAKGVTLKVNILNSDGVVLHSFDPVQTTLAMNESREFAFTWNTGLNPAGSYKAQTVLTKAELNLGEKTAAFSILPVLKFSSTLNTDKIHYGLKENVTLNLSVTNNGNTVASLLNLKLKIRPEGGQDLFVKDLSVADLGPGITTHLAENWNTAQYPAGNYQARLEVYLNNELVASSETVFIIDPVPIITGTLEIIPLKISQGENYQANYTVRNEGNVVIQNMPVKVLVNDSGQVKIAEQQELITLEIHESKTAGFTFGSQGYNIGMYQAVLQAVWDSAGHDLDRKAFEIIDSIPPFDKLTGTLQAAPNPVYQGQEESFQYTVRNDAGQALQGLLVKILVIDPATQETKITLSEQIDLPEKGVHTATLKAATNGLALKSYQTVLMVEMSGKVPRKLAETGFTVIAALDATKNLADETRLLVWVNDHCPSSCRPKELGALKDGLVELYSETGCNAGLQKEISVSDSLQSQDKLYCDPEPCKECLDLNLLKTILDQVADHYKIVFSPCAFADELRNPLYTDILVLGDNQPLQDHIATELRERVHSGTGLISSQWLKHGCSAAYDEVFGITYRGVLSTSDPLIETVPSPITTPGTFKAIGKSYNIQTDPDTLIAGWIKTYSKWQLGETRDTIMCLDPQGPYAAMVLHDYGKGRAIYQAFDLGRSLKETNKEWVQTLLDHSLRYVHNACSGNVFAPYELAPIRMALKNMGAVLIARVQESFPKELLLYDPIAKQWIDESPWVFDTGLDSNGEKEIPFYYLTPDKAGTFETQTDISIVLNGEMIPVKQLQLDLAVTKDLDLILDESINNLKALSLPPHDQARVKNALAALNYVKTKIVRTRSDVDYIIQKLIKAVDYLRSVKSGDMSSYRLELDRLVRSYGALYYLFVPAGEYLQGSLEATPNPVKTNQEVNFHVMVFNDGNEAFRDLILKVVIMDPNNGQVIKTLEKALVLEGNSSQELDLKTVLKSFKAKKYKLQLKAYSGLLLEPKVLAEGDLTVTAQ